MAVVRTLAGRHGRGMVLVRWRLRPAVGEPRMSLRSLLRLAYPRPLPARSPPISTSNAPPTAAAGANTVRGLSSVRAVLAALDDHSAPTPLSVRFGASDVVDVLVDGVLVALDTADDSVSGPMIRDRRYEPEVTRVLREVIRPGMPVLDVGAKRRVLHRPRRPGWSGRRAG